MVYSYVYLPLKFDQKMKLTTFLLIVSLFQIQANELYSQKTKISLNLENVSLEKVLIEIESLTEFKILYDDNEVDYNKIVSIKSDKVRVSKILKKLFVGTNVVFNVVDKQIVLKLKPHKETLKPLVVNKESIIQQKEMSGAVTDASGVPLPGASVMVLGTARGTSTDFDGKFKIKTTEGDILVFSYVGYLDVKVTVKNQATINVTMQEDIESLDDVVVVSFGKQKKSSIISSITTIKPSELKIPSSNLTTALAGRVAGLIAYQRSGEPGRDNAEFFVRGVTTFGYGRNPLILIDGIELNANDLRSLHPDDIKEFSIMKDASATALYGARGANGVIFVTTKEGVVGPVKISARYETSISSSTKNIELADPITYMRLHNEAVRTRNPLGVLPYSLGKVANTERAYNSGIDNILYPTTDWQDEMFSNNAINQRFNFSLNGGGKIARYYVSLAATQDNGILKVPKISNFNSNIDYRQYTIRSNININLSEKTELKVSFNANLSEYTGPRSGGTDVFNMVMRTNPVLFKPFYEKDEDHRYTQHVLFGGIKSGASAFVLNPYAQVASGYREDNNTKVIARIELNHDFSNVTDGLRYKFILNGTKESEFSVERFYNPFYYSPFYNKVTKETILTRLNPLTGTEYLNYSEGGKKISSSTYIENNLSYHKEINEKHDVSGLLVFTMNNRQFSNTGSLQKSLPYRNMGLAGRFTYGYDDKYFAEFDFGYNGSERFAKNERWGFFPSVAAGWMVSNEKFFEKFTDVVSKLKFKGSYGIAGNDQIGDENDRFFYLSEVNIGDPAQSYRTGYNLTSNANRLNGVTISRYGNDQITWETAKKMNLGLELGLFNKLDLEVDIFKEVRSNILANRNLPSFVGLQTSVQGNIGEVEGKGLDASLTYNTTIGKDAWLQARGNFTYATNKVNKYHNQPDYSETPWLSREGRSIHQQWGYVAEKLFLDEQQVANSPLQTLGEYGAGDLKYRDINGDDKISGLDQVPIGNPTVPEIIYGFGFSVGYKGFDLSTFFQGAANSSFWVDTAPRIEGGKLIPGVSPFTSFGGGSNNQLLKAFADDHWSENNRDSYALWPRLSPNIIKNNTTKNTWFMQDGSFLRMKSAEIGFTIPSKTTSRLNIDKIRLYASATNLFVISKFKLWDPELAGNGLGYPVQRVINFGVNVSL